MRSLTMLLALATAASAQPGAILPKLVELKQAPARPHDKLTLPKGHKVGPALPGLRQGWVPQGLAFWEAHNLFLVSYYFHAEGETKNPSVVVALDAKTGKMLRCLTLVEAGGKAHTGHVGGLAVSGKYLWVGSGGLYRASLADVLAAKHVDYLRLQPPFHAESDASYVAYEKRPPRQPGQSPRGQVWVGEFVSADDPKFKGKPAHRLKDRNNKPKHAWVCCYPLDAQENLFFGASGKRTAPAAILCVRDNVQGLAFHQGHVILSTSYGRAKDSRLAVYKNPLPAEVTKPDEWVKLGKVGAPLWFLDGKNQIGKEIDFPPMSEGITAYGPRLAVLCESGAERYRKAGHTPLDNIIFLESPGRK